MCTFPKTSSSASDFPLEEVAIDAVVTGSRVQRRLSLVFPFIVATVSSLSEGVEGLLFLSQAGLRVKLVVGVLWFQGLVQVVHRQDVDRVNSGSPDNYLFSNGDACHIC